MKQAGSAFGLYLTLNVHQEEYYGVMSSVAGLKIFIHHRDTIPLVSQFGFAVGTGSSTFAAIRKQRVRILLNSYSVKLLLIYRITSEKVTSKEEVDGTYRDLDYFGSPKSLSI